MTVYFLLYFVILAIKAVEKSKLKLYKYKNEIIKIVFIIIIIIIGLRNIKMGNDLPGYLLSFRLCERFSLQEMILLRGDNYEIGYIVFMKLVSLFTNNENVFLLVCAITSIAPIAYVIIKKNSDWFFSTITFIALPSFLMLFSALRQSIAFAICFYSILFIQEKKPFKFMICIFIACLFHSSSIIFVIAYPLYYIRIPQKYRLSSLICIALIYIFRIQLFTLISPFLDKQYVSINITDSIGIYFFLILIYLTSILFSNCNKKEMNGYLNILYFGIVCQSFVSINNMAMRIAEYFILILVLLIPQMLFDIKLKVNKQIITIAFSVLLVIMGLMFLYQGGQGWAKSYPYLWFWN